MPVPTRIQIVAAAATGVAALLTAACGVSANSNKTVVTEGATVGVTKIGRRSLERKLTQSSELVPYQEIDVYAKESGFVKKLNVDYGSRVKTGDLMAVLEIPELEAQIAEDEAAIKNAQQMIGHAQEELHRRQDVANVLHLEYTRLNQVAKAKPGLVAQQEVDDKQGQDLAAQAQVSASEATLAAAQSALEQAQAKRIHDQTLFDYSKITAPFDGVVTQRYANYGTLMQAAQNSSNSVLPLVQLSEDDRYRLVIPVPESYVRFIHDGDPVEVSVTSLNKTFPGKVARTSLDVKEDTRTMHTEVDVYNPNHVLYPGLYADATLTLEKKRDVLAVPLQAVDRNGDNTTVDLVTAQNKIEIRPVTLGIQTANDAEVLSGLNEGDTVVVSDRSSLKDAQPVQPKMIDLLQYHQQDQPH